MKAKVFFLLGIVLFTSTLLNSALHAATYVNVGVGVGGFYPYRAYYYRPYYYPYAGPYPYYYGPTVLYSTPVYTSVAPTTITTTKTTTVSKVVTQKPKTVPQTSAPPYGVPGNGNVVKSPFSNFTINAANLKTGSVIYDAYTGQPFRIP